MINQRVDFEAVGCRHHQDLTCQMGRGEALRQMGETTGKFRKFRFKLWGDQGQPGTGCQQQARLAQGNLAPAHQQYRAAFQLGKHR